MKALKALVVMSMVFVLVGAAAFAQGRGERGERGGRAGRGQRAGGRQGGAMGILNRIGELDLTDEQREKIDKLRTEFEEKMKGSRETMRTAFTELRAYREKNPDDREGLRKKRQEMMQKMAPMREGMQGFIESVKGVLNEEQLKKFNEMVAAGGGPGGRRGRAAGGRFGGAGARLPGLDPRAIEQLNLTDEQKEKVKGLLQAFAEEQKTLIEKYQGLFKEMLTPEQQEAFEKAKVDADKRRQEMRERFRRGGRDAAGEGGARGAGGAGGARGERRQRRQRTAEDEG